jgi:hypothetical protein
VEDIGSSRDAILFMTRVAIQMDRGFIIMTKYLCPFWAFYAKQDAQKAGCQPQQVISSSERPFLIKVGLQVVQLAEELNIPRMAWM